nr:RNA polymerase sigma factor [Sphingomonas colocasiae]
MLHGVIRRRLGTLGEWTPDVLQDLYLKWAMVTNRFDDRGDARAFLIRMAINLAVDRRKVATRRLEILQIQEGRVDDGPEPAFIAAQDVLAIERALKARSSRTHEVLMLTRAHGMLNRDAADELGLSLRSIEHHLTLARTICKLVLSADAPPDTARPGK